MIIADKPKFKMAVLEDRKEAHVQVIGFVTEDVVEDYIQSLQLVGKNCTPSQYTLVIDATLQSPVPRKVAAELGDTMMIYTTFGYRDIVIIRPKSKIAMVQIRNGLEPKNFPGEFYDTVEGFRRR
ncbi:MAG: hypothetical protein KIG60_10145 [Caryophanon sp.]|nr:hypothetical protein [Caryophanon sp.]